MDHDSITGAANMVSAYPNARLAREAPSILLTAGFGDGAEMFDGLLATELASHYRLVPIDLPGFGGAHPLPGQTSLASLAEFLHARAKMEKASIIVAHSASSIVAALAAEEPDSPIDTIICLEGNITAGDAYYSGSAADYADPVEFKAAFLRRIEELSKTQPVFRRYHSIVSRADSRALWDLGRDVRRFSEAHVPGDRLAASCRRVIYVHDPANCPRATLDWLQNSSIELVRTDGVSHWMSVDQPKLLSALLLQALRSD